MLSANVIGEILININRITGTHYFGIITFASQ